MTDTYKILGKVAPTNGDAVSLYTVPSNKSAIVSNITVTNRGTAEDTFDIATGPLVGSFIYPFVAIGKNSTNIAYSTDSITWTAKTMPISSTWDAISYGNGNFVTLYAESPTSTRVYYSTDLVTWSNSQISDGSTKSKIIYGNGKFIFFGSGTNAFYSTTLDSFTVSTLPSSSTWISGTYGNGVFVVVAQNSTAAASSTNGITWTLRTLPASDFWQSVTYGNGVFVAICNLSTIAATSTDGITWTQRTTPFSGNWYAITYGNGLFVAVESGSTAAVSSTDGITWTTRTLPSSGNWRSVTYNNGVFVTLANNSTNAASSTDGITWTLRTLPSSSNWISVTGSQLPIQIISPEKYIYKGTSIPAKQTLILDPGMSLNQNNSVVVRSSANTNISIHGVEVDEVDKYKILGQRALTSAEEKIYSPSASKQAIVRGLNITNTSAVEDNVTIALVNDSADKVSTPIFVAVANNLSNLAVSTDGITWTTKTRPSAASGTFASIAYGNGIFATLRSLSNTNTAVYYSTDLVTWSLRDISDFNPKKFIFYGNQKFILIGEGTNYFYSTDFSSVTSSTLPSSSTWISGVYGDGLYVVIARNSTATAASTDGITWTSGSLPSSYYWSSVAYGNGKFVAVGSNSDTSAANLAAYSTDGITWTASTLANSFVWNSVTYGNGIFVAVAVLDALFDLTNIANTSTDGITWESRSLPQYASWESVTYANGTFIAINSYPGNTASLSTDGITWTLRTLPSSAQWKSVAGGQFPDFTVSTSNSDYILFDSPVLGNESITFKAGYSMPNNSAIRAISKNGTSNISAFGVEL